MATIYYCMNVYNANKEYELCDMPFIEPMYCNKPNIT